MTKKQLKKTKKHLLMIKAGPTYDQKDHPISEQALRIFLKKYQATHPNDQITVLDLNKITLFHQALNETNFQDFIKMTGSRKYINQLKNATKIVIATPMHNLSYSGLLKNYLDWTFVAHQTFYYSKWGVPVGLLKGKKVQIIGIQGSPKLFGFNVHHIKSLKRTIKTFSGMKVVKPLVLHSLNFRGNFQKTKAQKIAIWTKRIQKRAQKF